jgi:uncharacterized membrane protein YhaH (DUF805 family)
VTVLQSCRHNLSSLTQFSGRDAPSQFWPWTIIIFLTAFGLSSVAMAVGMSEVATVYAQVHQGTLPETAAVQATLELGWLWLPLAIIATTATALLAASVTRRLHDSGRRGVWGLLPLPFLALSIGATPIGFRIASGQEQLSGLEAMMLFGAPLFYVALAFLGFLLGRAGDTSANRFGPPQKHG